MFAEAVEIRDRLAVLVDRLDPDAFSGSAARELWGVLDASERLCAAGKTLLARRVAETHRPEQRGTKTAAEELARRSGTLTGAAKDAVDTSQRLPEQPRVDAALRRGELSPAQAVAISSAVAANSAEEARLVELASRVSLAELREECARVRAAADPNPEATNRRLHAARRLSRWIDAEGFWSLHAKGTPQAGAVFNTVLDPIIDRIFKAARAQGRREHPDAYAFDAVMHLADHAAGHCDCQADTAGADTAGADTAGPDVAEADAARAEAAKADTAGADAAGTDTSGPCAAEADAARAEAAQADTAGADAEVDAATGSIAGQRHAGAGLDAGSRRAATEGAATSTGDRQAADPAGRTDPGVGRGTVANPTGGRSADAAVVPPGADAGSDGLTEVNREPGTAIRAGEPGIFAVPADSIAAGTSAGPWDSGCAARPAGSSNPRYLALLRVDVAALRRGRAQGEELCEIAGVGPIPVSVAKDALGEAIVKLVITNGVDVANVTHLGRGPTAAQRAALLWMNPTCSVEGCNRRRIEYDHQKPWADTRHTRLDELDPLCGFHHDLKTRLGYALIAGTGKRPFVAPDDPRHPRNLNRANGGTSPSPGACRTTSNGPPTQARQSRSTITPALAPPGRASRVRTVRAAARAQMTLPEPPASPAPQPP